MSGRLTTHVLDTSRGCPAAGITISLTRVAPDRKSFFAAVTNADGRCDSPLLQGEDFCAGTYELRFFVAAYFARTQTNLPDPPFLDEILLRFGIADAAAHTHVPLLVSPYAYSTYRGS